MGRIFIGILTLSVALVILYFSGPKVDTSFELKKSDLASLQLNDLDSYLQEQEKKLPELWDNAHREIVWFHDTPQKTDWSVIYLHGFTAIKTETAPLSQNIAQSLEANLYLHRFPGHGLPGNYLSEISAQDWLQSGLDAIQIGNTIGEKTLVIGCSNGGSIAWILSHQIETPKIDLLVLLSPNIAPHDMRADIILWPWGLALGEFLAGKQQHWNFEKPEEAEHWTSPYPTSSLGPLMAISWNARLMDPSDFHSQAMVFLNPYDGIVDSKITMKIAARYDHAKLESIVITEDTDNAHHVIAGNLRSPTTTDFVAQKIVSKAMTIETNHEDLNEPTNPSE